MKDTSEFLHRRPPDDEMMEDLRKFLPEGPGGAPYVDWLDKLVNERRRIRRDALRREHDLETLASIVRELSERTLDPRKLELYLLRTMMGRFLVWKVMIFRRSTESDRLKLTAARGLGHYREHAEEGYAVLRDSLFVDMLAQKRAMVDLTHCDSEFSQLPEARMLRETGIETVVPLIASEDSNDKTVEGFLALGPRLGGRRFRNSDKRFLKMLGGIIAVACRNEILFKRSILDDLTKIASRGHFDSMLAAEVARCSRYDREGFALIMMDIDGFKQFNDKYGHQAGDCALRRVSATLGQCLRSSDLLARYGGEEFAAILVEVPTIGDACQIAERMRIAVNNRPVAERDNHELRLSLSLGVARFPDDATTAHGLIAAADAALYRAKSLGRNRVCMAECIERTAVG